ncbi:conjugal transfer protein [Salmonella enterica subsp. enterica serovar Hillingdon]|uniref:VirB4 family type IV secretion/conjugal transfer ATPase n=1 Tax=Salmonella enterica TaxID=28901 RepID=UPI0009B1A8D8|nr:VirB4 family type IV secretion system protein [Salmonella enterica]EBW2268513.1 conjugal transfer protein [Salmonella enterica subsp. enterica serovar Hillingdon]ECB6312606.1 conjugal transfer protein [Salmonella enterica subsp. enterica serovar Chailey]EDR0865635.1 conjugal transfer protein [Salmonella enterica subsp. enterica serovar Hillingdon]EDR6326927.1 conjugal transfer protein [Salmonella enterica subsp. enterica serovar Hillingdon]
MKISDKFALNHDEYYPAMRYHVTPNIATLTGEHLLAVISLAGTPHETTEHYKLIRAFNHLNTFIRTIGRNEGADLALWTYVDKRKIRLSDVYKTTNPYCQAFIQRYVERFNENDFFTVEYAIAIILKYQDYDDGKKRLTDILRRAENSLRRYDVSILGIYENSRGVAFSEPGEFFSRFYNGYSRPVPVCDNPLCDSLIDSEIAFGYDFIEFHPNSGGTRYAVTYDLNEYPATSGIGMWDELLAIPCEFRLTQSFHTIERNTTKGQFERHVNNLRSSEGETEQLRELEAAQEHIATGQILFGEYHAALVVYGETKTETLNAGAKIVDAFSASGAGWVRSTSTNIYTFFSQFPGAYTKNIPFPAPKTTRNLVCGFSLHNSPVGKQYGNPIGDGSAIMPMFTEHKSLFFLNNHVSPLDQNNTGEPYAGHSIIMGATGTGKTTFEGTILTFTMRFDPMLFAIDYNRSNENFLRAVGTHYLVIRRGEYTGIQPFQFPDNPQLRNYLYEMVETAAGGADVVTGAEGQEIKLAVDAVLSLSNIKDRRFSTLLQMIPPKGGNSLYTRLSKWCAATNGKHAWALDSPENTFDPADFRRLAFDSTDIMQSPDETTEAVLGMLFFVKEVMHRKGGLLLNLIAEFWVPANLPTTAAKMKDILKAGRMRLEYLIMDTQSPEDAINCSIFDAIIQMTPTKLFLPNPEAAWESYQKCGLTRREYEKLAELDKYSRKLLLKQGSQSCILDYGLYGFDDFLPVISSTKENVEIAARIRREVGDDPAVWVPAFQDEMRRQREAQRAPRG